MSEGVFSYVTNHILHKDANKMYFMSAENFYMTDVSVINSYVLLRNITENLIWKKAPSLIPS